MRRLIDGRQYAGCFGDTQLSLQFLDKPKRRAAGDSKSLDGIANACRIRETGTLCLPQHPGHKLGNALMAQLFGDFGAVKKDCPRRHFI